MRASLVVLTYNQLQDGTIPCVDSLYLYTPMDQFELVLVDNASTDGTPDHLRSLEKKYDNLKVVLNSVNKGYAGGNNDGLRVAKGDCIVLLNNDTMVTPGWLDALLKPLEQDRSIGLMSPVTNSAGNEQMVLLNSLNEENYVEVSGRYTRRNAGHLFDTEKLGFYCVALRRDVLEKVGTLDENFGLGMFEDDDYCLRVRKAGFRLVINEGCFVYHKGSLSFKKLIEKEYQDIFERNRAYYEKKHGQPWLFNDLTLAFYRQMEREVRALLQKDASSKEAERIAVRLKGFEYLINNAREMEKKGGRGNQLRGQERSLRRLYRLFRDEYLRGDRRSRHLFVRKVRRQLRPLKNQDIIDRLGDIRRKEGFKHLMIFVDGGDHAADGPEKSLADALAASGQTVLYGTMNRDKDLVEVVESPLPHLHVMNQELFGFLPHLVTPAEAVVYLAHHRSWETALSLKPKRVIVELGGDDKGWWMERLKAENIEALFLSDEDDSKEMGDKKVKEIKAWLDRQA